MSEERQTPGKPSEQSDKPDENAPLVAGHPDDDETEDTPAATPHTDPRENEPDEWGEESFPASDPPANY